MSVIKCDKCGRKFSHMDIKIKDRILDKENDVREEYYKCPKCKAKYTILVTDPDVRALISEGDKAAAKLRELTLRERYRERLEK